MSHYLFFSLFGLCKGHVNRWYNWLCWKYDSHFFLSFLMLICVIVTDIVFKDPSATSAKKITKATPVSEKSSLLPEGLSSSSQPESPKSSHQGRTAPPKTFPKIKVWKMNIDPALKVTVLMKKPFHFFCSCCMCVLSFPNFFAISFLLHIYTCPSFSHCVYSVFALLIHIQKSCCCRYSLKDRTCNIIASILYEGLVLAPIP
jgi:hypothetical protein